MHESLQYDFSIDMSDNELSRNKNSLKEYGGLRLLEKDVCKYRIMKGNPQINEEVGLLGPSINEFIVNIV
ncbi:MAG: hypothetical protein RIT37_823 [Bacteroidota bacterium]|jgi:hypothetical protein